MEERSKSEFSKPERVAPQKTNSIQPMRTRVATSGDSKTETSASLSSRTSKATNAANEFSPWERLILQFGRFLTLIALVYTTWRFGGTDWITQYHVSVLILASLLFAGIAWRGSSKRTPFPTAIVAIGFIACAFTFFQTIELPRVLIRWIAPGTESVLTEFSDPVMGRLAKSIDTLRIESIDEVVPLRTESTISIDSASSLTRVATWQLALGFMILAPALFFTRNSRRVLAWTLIVNTACLAFWGLAQRASGTTDLLPGFSKEMVTLPFSTFIYKNAGAAALMPGLAIVVGLFWNRSQRSPVSRQSPRISRGGDYYRASPLWTQPRFLSLMCLVGLIVAGLLASSSRGAWIAVTVAAISIVVTMPQKFSPKAILGIGVVGILCVAIITVTGLKEDLQKQSERLEVDRVTNDARFTHWNDGWRTAMKHLPFGSGAGTFGYAHLPQQVADTEQWFRESHNQYLETFVELGLPGFLLLLAMMALFAQAALYLVRNSSSHEHFCWGIIGLFCLVAVAVQSLVDFVILIPGVLFAVALVMGCTATVFSRDRELSQVVRRTKLQRDSQNFKKSVLAAPLAPSESSRTETDTSSDSSPSRFQYARNQFLKMALRPTVWCIATSIVVAISMVNIGSRLASDAAIKMTRFPSDAYEPNDAEVEFNIAILDSAISSSPRRAELYRQRGFWHLANYRIVLMKESAKDDSPLNWASTSPDYLFQALSGLEKTDRKKIAGELVRSNELKRPLSLALVDFAQSLDRNPLNPNLLLTCALLTPLSGDDAGNWVKEIQPLAHSSRQIQFANGLLAFHSEEFELMAEQWRSSIAFGEEYFQPIVTLATRKMSFVEIAEKIVPMQRPDLLVKLVLYANESRVSKDSFESLTKF